MVSCVAVCVVEEEGAKEGRLEEDFADVSVGFVVSIVFS